MVKGRRKREPMHAPVDTRRSPLDGSADAVVSPLRKESKLENGRANRTEPQTRLNAKTQKATIRITSYFSAQQESVLRVKTSRGKQNSEFLNETENYNGANIKVEKVEEERSSIDEMFKTDETPVAVPCRDPPTPHRINMPESVEEPEVKLEKGDAEKKARGVGGGDIGRAALALSPIQRIAKKLGGRGRGKVKGNSSAATRTGSPPISRTVDSPLEVKTNHKVTEYFPVRRSVRKCKKTVLEERQRDLENKVVCQVEDGLEVQHFVGKGRGVVTTREFAKGEFVVEYVGDLIDQVSAKKREAIYALDQNTGCYMYYFQHRGVQYCVDATAESKKLGRLVNHSRNGNLVARVVEVESTPHLVLTAKEDVPKGVEVTYDYGDRSREAIRNHPWLAL